MWIRAKSNACAALLTELLYSAWTTAFRETILVLASQELNLLVYRNDSSSSRIVAAIEDAPASFVRWVSILHSKHQRNSGWIFDFHRCLRSVLLRISHSGGVVESVQAKPNPKG